LAHGVGHPHWAGSRAGRTAFGMRFFEKKKRRNEPNFIQQFQRADIDLLTLFCVFFGPFLAFFANLLYFSRLRCTRL
jgi:hypothetical protein